jgi:hypothetical protein
MLQRVRSRMQLPPGASQASRRDVQRAMLALQAQGAFGRPDVPPGQRAGESEDAFTARLGRESIARMRSASARATRHEMPCAGCGAVPERDVPRFRRCGACNAVAYCGVECQRLHWRRQHKRECSTLAGKTADE